MFFHRKKNVSQTGLQIYTDVMILQWYYSELFKPEQKLNLTLLINPTTPPDAVYVKIV